MGVAGSNRRGRGAGPSEAGSFRATIRSDFEAGRDVQERILRDIERLGYSEESSFAIRIALEEAMVNAIKHGNRLDPRKKVHVESHITPKRAEITIEDEGPGFDRTSIPDPTHDDNLHKPSGRGILLMEAYMNSVKFSRRGRCVCMVKKNEPKN